MMSCTGSVRGGFWGFEKCQSVELSSSVRRRRLTFGARRSLTAGVARGLGQMEKSS